MNWKFITKSYNRWCI